MSLINAPKGTVAVIFSVLLTVLAGCFFPALGAGVAQSFEISSLASIAIPKQTQSAHTHGQIVAANAGRGLGDYLREDGTLDLVSGLHGSLDARGYRLASGPTETPRFERVSATGDEGWADGFGLRGIDGKVYALAVDGSGNLYAGGEFTVAGAILANNIAKWNGSSWEALGTGIDHSVYALAVDGSGNLYAGGKFYRAGGVSVHHIAKWNGASWEALGTGMDDQVNALAIDGQGNIYAGGLFSTAGGVAAPDIAKWNGSSWKAVGSGMRGYVFALAVDGSDNLYAGGSFSTAGGVSVNNIAKWNGSSWEALGSGIQGTTDRVGAADALAVDGSGNVYAGGRFTTAGGVSAKNIAKWNGSSWEALGSGMEGEVRDLALDGNGNLYAGGYFTKAGGVDAKHVAKWDGSSWEALWTGINNNVSALTVDSNGNLYAGGKFSKAGGVTVNSIAVWYGGEWSAIYAGDGNGINGDVKALALDGNGNLYAGGDFTTAGGVSARRIAKWNGSSWEALGSGMGFYQKGANAYVAALAADSSGNVYAGGKFNEAGGVTARSIAKWNGSSWEALGSGVGGGGGDPVTALAVDGSGNVYAGGQFTTAGGVSAKNIAKWNGSSWEALGSGIEGPYYQYNLYALAVDGSGNLYAGGHFNKAGGVSANKIAKWNGSSWEALGSGTGEVKALAVDGSGNVYAGGYFTTAGGVSANKIAKWNGSSWEALGSGTNYYYVAALAVDGSGNVYAGGQFFNAGGISANGVCS